MPPEAISSPAGMLAERNQLHRSLTRKMPVDNFLIKGVAFLRASCARQFLIPFYDRSQVSPICRHRIVLAATGTR